MADNTAEQLRMQHLEKDLERAFGRIEDLEANLNAYKEEERKRETRNLRTALIAAGGIILALGSFLFYEIIWPLIKIAGPK